MDIIAKYAKELLYIEPPKLLDGPEIAIEAKCTVEASEYSCDDIERRGGRIHPVRYGTIRLGMFAEKWFITYPDKWGNNSMQIDEQDEVNEWVMKELERMTA